MYLLLLHYLKTGVNGISTSRTPSGSWCWHSLPISTAEGGEARRVLLLKTKNLGASSLSLPSVKICVFHFAVFIFATLFRCIAEVKMAASAPVMRYAAARIAFLSLKFLTCFLCNELQHMSFTILSAFNNVAWNSGVLSLDPLLCVSLWCLASNWVVEHHFLRCQFTLDSNP